MTTRIGPLLLLALGWGCGPNVSVQGQTDGLNPSSTGASTTTPTPTSTTTTTSTTTSMTTSTTVGGEDNSTGEAWMLDVPGAGEECSIWDQNCAEGFKCMPYSNDGGPSWNAVKCTPIDPDPVGLGEPCVARGSGVSGVDNCELGAMCWDLDPDTLEGTCVPLCSGTPDDPQCPDACQTCAISGEGVLNLCFETCDPLAQDCGDGKGCYPVTDTFSCVPDASDGSEPGQCESINGCPAGQACVNPDVVPDCEGFGCCAPLCSTALPDTCDSLLPGTVCTPWYEAEPPHECIRPTVGVCMLP